MDSNNIQLSDYNEQKRTQPNGALSLSAHRKYQIGSDKAIHTLAQLQFDPIIKLVSQYEKIEKEIAYQEDIRSGKRVELSASTGKPRAYRPEVHHSLYNQLSNIATQLLRYRYGRVSELNAPTADNTKMPLLVTLTGKGTVYQIGDTDVN